MGFIESGVTSPSCSSILTKHFFLMKTLDSTLLEEAIEGFRIVTEAIVDLKSRPNTRTGTEYLASLEQKHKTYSEVIILHQHFQKMPSFTFDQQKESENHHQFKIPPNLPTFQAQNSASTFDVHHFLDALEAILLGNKVHVKIWPKILLATIPPSCWSEPEGWVDKVTERDTKLNETPFLLNKIFSYNHNITPILN